MLTDRLSAPPNARLISKQRGAGGNEFEFIPVDATIGQANRLFGFDAWATRITDCRQVGDEWIVQIELQVYADKQDSQDGFQNTVSRAGIGKSATAAKAYGYAIQSALKTFGRQFGLGL